MLTYTKFWIGREKQPGGYAYVLQTWLAFIDEIFILVLDIYSYTLVSNSFASCTWKNLPCNTYEYDRLQTDQVISCSNLGRKLARLMQSH
jgi:hypothetical protein